MKRLYKSKTDRIISGVCGGIANYLNVDPTLVRVVLVICVFLGGVGILAYIVAIFIIPEKPVSTSSASEQKTGDVFESDSNDNDKLHSESHMNNPVVMRTNISYTAGIILIILGIIALSVSFGWLHLDKIWRYFWPALLVFIGIMVIVANYKK